MFNRDPANAAEMGTKNYRERIHKESKFADDHKKLPFKFSKPKKNKPCSVYAKCQNCEKEFFLTEDTLVVICGVCKHINRVKDLIAE